MLFFIFITGFIAGILAMGVIVDRPGGEAYPGIVPARKGGCDVHIKPTPISHCQSCLRDFRSGEVVYFAPVDNTIVCSDCAKAHQEPRPRIYEKEV